MTAAASSQDSRLRREQPEEVDINEILFRPTRQEL